MRLYEEIFLRAEGASGAKCLIVPCGGGYFEGVKSVGEFSPERIELFFRAHAALVDGEELLIRKYCDGDLELSGKILSVRFLGAGGSEKQ